jgi:large subunit ribosomal protein L31
MKTNLHPKYYSECLVACSCGNTFKTGSTKEEIHVEVCYKCHPLYTGEKRYLDSLGQVGKFQQKQKLAAEHQKYVESKKSQKEDKKQTRPKTLRELLMEE